MRINPTICVPLKKWNQEIIKKPSITFDTNCVISIGKDNDVDKLIEWEQKGLIEIFKTDVMDTELKNTSSRQKSSTFKEDIGVAVIGHSRIGHAKIGGGEDQSFFEQMLQFLFPETKGQRPTRNQTRDTMHIITHRDNGRDHYITSDGDFLTKKDQLKTNYAISVMTPKECVDYLKNKLNLN